MKNKFLLSLILTSSLHTMPAAASLLSEQTVSDKMNTTNIAHQLNQDPLIKPYVDEALSIIGLNTVQVTPDLLNALIANRENEETTEDILSLALIALVSEDHRRDYAEGSADRNAMIGLRTLGIPPEEVVDDMLDAFCFLSSRDPRESSVFLKDKENFQRFVETYYTVSWFPPHNTQEFEIYVAYNEFLKTR